MLVYWLSCLLSMIMTWFSIHIKHSHKGFLYWSVVAFFSSLPLIIIAAVRFNVGSDYYGYYKYYLGCLYGSILEPGRFEILYRALNQCIAFFDGSPVLFFGVCAAFFLIPVYKTIIDDSPYPLMSIFLLFGMTYYFFFLNATRQMLGAAFLMLALTYAWKRKLIPFLAFVFIATGFHTSSIIFLLVYPILKIKLKISVIYLITIGCFIFSQAIGDLGNSFISNLDYYSLYLRPSFHAEVGYITLAINLSVLIFATVFYQSDPKFRAYYLMQVITLWICALNGNLAMIDRFRMTFGLFSIILVPMTISKISDKRIRLIIVCFIGAMYFVYSTYTIGILRVNEVVPYQTVFDYSISN